MAKDLIKLHTVKGETIAVFPGDFIIVDNGDHRSLYTDTYDYNNEEDDATSIDVIESLDEIINQNND